MRGSFLSLRVLGLLEIVCPAEGVCSGGRFPGKVEVNPFDCPWKPWLFLQLTKVSLLIFWCNTGYFLVVFYMAVAAE